VARPQAHAYPRGLSCRAGGTTVLFYLYATDLVSLRDQLAGKGLQPGEISFPEYLPNREFPMQDPDGYVLMIAQSAADTQ